MRICAVKCFHHTELDITYIIIKYISQCVFAYGRFLVLLQVRYFLILMHLLAEMQFP